MMSAAVEQSRRKEKEASPSCGLSSLPDEMAINCFARVSRLDRAALSTVSKSYRSLVVSPEFYETRSRMGWSEECIYAFLDTPRKPNPHWFILRRGKGKSFVNRLIPIPSFPTPREASFVAVGCGIYVIGGIIDFSKTTLVSFLDCRTHTWSYVPSMRIARACADVGVLDGKIYVFGGYDEEENDPSNWAEVFDPKMQTWSRVIIPVPVMNKEICNVYGLDTVFYYFRSEEGIWNDCAIDDRLLYCCDHFGRIMWCDPLSGVRQGRMEWRKVYGLDDLQGSFKPFSRSINFCGEMADVWHFYLLSHGFKNGLIGLLPGFKLTNSGGNIFIFWDLLVEDDPKRLEIWCAEISMEMRQGGQIWGTVQWSNPVFSIDPIPDNFKVFCSVSVKV